MKAGTALLPTEQNNPRTLSIGHADTLDVLRMIHEEDARAVAAMEAALPSLAAAADGIADRLEAGGRLFYVGAGTSGRIGVLDASELPATYGVDPSLVRAIVPGGYDTLPDARLGDEDDRQSAVNDLQREGLTAADAVVGIAASGRTPYTHEALLYATKVGALTVALVNVPDSLMASAAAVTVVSETGAEAIQGSTRMKAGTTQKLALNMLSTAVMIRLGKVYKNRMIEVTAINDKLVERSVRMLMELTGAAEDTALRVLEDCRYQVKTAVVAITTSCDAAAAEKQLADHGGRLGHWLWEEIG